MRGPRKKWTHEERAAFEARDRSWLTRFLAGEAAVEAEVVAKLVKMGCKLAMARGDWSEEDWLAHQAEYVVLLYRYRERGLLRVGEPLFRLAGRLVKQVGRRADRDARRDKAALRWGAAGEAEHGGEDEWDDRLEVQAQSAPYAQRTFARPDAGLETEERLGWLEQAARELLPGDRETLAAELAAGRGEHESLAAALHISEAAARQRRCRMTKALRAIARKWGRKGSRVTFSRLGVPEMGRGRRQ